MKERQLTLLFLRRPNQILLAMKKRGFGVGHWNGVGGKLEAGETVEQAVIRECQEEIGVTVSSFNKVAEILFDEYDGDQPLKVNVHVFTTEKWEGEPVETEEMAPQWFEIDDVPFDKMWPDDRHWLPLVLEDMKIAAHFKLDKDKKILNKKVTVVDTFS